MLLINQNFLFPWLSESSFSLEFSPEISNLDNSITGTAVAKMSRDPLADKPQELLSLNSLDFSANFIPH